jgi:ankyrin repeat protein
MKTFLSLLAILLTNAFCVLAFAKAEDFAAAVSDGKVSVTFRGNGGSSGDSIEATIATTPKADGNLVLSIAPGTRLQSGNSTAQSMVIAGVKGQLVSGHSYSPSSIIIASDTPKTYVFDAYCTDFEKDNPSSQTQFTLGKADPVLACILNQASSTTVKQAAVWIYTDKASYVHVNQKFAVSQSDWDTASAIVRQCSVSSVTPRFNPRAAGQEPPNEIHNAAAHDYLAKVKAMLENGTDVNLKDSEGLTPLHVAALTGHKDIAELLLANGADVNARSDGGLTPLHQAAYRGHKDISELLLRKGADVNAKASHDETPLFLAAGTGYKDLAELLLTNGADVNAMAKDGAMPLHQAAANGNKRLVEFLLAKGADINKKTNHGETPLVYAAAGGHKDIAELLLAKGADVNAKNQDGRTPLYWAIQKHYDDVAELLRVHGAKE